MTFTTPQKWLMGAGVVLAYLVYKAGTANAATSPSGAGAAVSAGAGGGGTPNAGDGLMVVTQDTGASGRLNVRTNPGANYPEVALVDHGGTVYATGNAKQATDGSTWWEVTTQQGGGTKGWAESNYLQNLGPMTTVSAATATPATVSA